MQYKSTLRHPRTQDLTGLPFGDWTVLCYAGRTPHHSYWTCQCACGIIRHVNASSLLHGDSQSCGCRGRFRRGKARTHGRSRTPEYHVWAQMLQRCENPLAQGYPLYGARGITVCETWHDFAAFYADMGPRPSDQHTLERVDNMRGYEPDNCIWATHAVQNRNNRRTVLLTFDGTTQCLQDWAKAIGMEPATLHNRLRNGWTVEDALTTPSSHHNPPRHRKNKVFITFEGRTQSLKAWAEERGVPYAVYQDRHAHGWNIEHILLTPYTPMTLRKGEPQAILCHPERPRYAKGLCASCYVIDRRRQRQEVH